mmetsp:Transcript_68050/g.197172  ORF Transcript_68050/g.197172 Transcript_68050/m.197172 type:complete len:336 (+) Transcript_68050:84-1091(+)
MAPASRFPRARLCRAHLKCCARAEPEHHRGGSPRGRCGELRCHRDVSPAEQQLLLSGVVDERGQQGGDAADGCRSFRMRRGRGADHVAARVRRRFHREDEAAAGLDGPCAPALAGGRDASALGARRGYGHPKWQGVAEGAGVGPTHGHERLHLVPAEARGVVPLKDSRRNGDRLANEACAANGQVKGARVVAGPACADAFRGHNSALVSLDPPYPDAPRDGGARVRSASHQVNWLESLLLRRAARLAEALDVCRAFIGRSVRYSGRWRPRAPALARRGPGCEGPLHALPHETRNLVEQNGRLGLFVTVLRPWHAAHLFDPGVRLSPDRRFERGWR